MSEGPQEKREIHVGPLPQEDVNTLEYTRSLESLRRFAELDVTEIQNLEDLSAKTSLIGHDIKTVVLAQGVIEETEFDYQAYIIRKPKGDHEIVALSNQDQADIKAYKIIGEEQLGEFLVRLPANRDINRLSGNQIIDGSNLQAIDWRFGKTVHYYPASDPTDPKVNQGFAAVLQDGVKELLSVLPEPTKIPDIFKF